MDPFAYINRSDENRIWSRLWAYQRTISINHGVFSPQTRRHICSAHGKEFLVVLPPIAEVPKDLFTTLSKWGLRVFQNRRQPIVIREYRNKSRDEESADDTVR